MSGSNEPDPPPNPSAVLLSFTAGSVSREEAERSLEVFEAWMIIKHPEQRNEVARQVNAAREDIHRIDEERQARGDETPIIQTPQEEVEQETVSPSPAGESISEAVSENSEEFPTEEAPLSPDETGKWFEENEAATLEEATQRLTAYQEWVDKHGTNGLKEETPRWISNVQDDIRRIHQERQARREREREATQVAAIPQEVEGDTTPPPPPEPIATPPARPDDPLATVTRFEREEAASIVDAQRRIDEYKDWVSKHGDVQQKQEAEREIASARNDLYRIQSERDQQRGREEARAALEAQSRERERVTTTPSPTDQTPSRHGWRENIVIFTRENRGGLLALAAILILAALALVYFTTLPADGQNNGARDAVSSVLGSFTTADPTDEQIRSAVGSEFENQTERNRLSGSIIQARNEGATIGDMKTAVDRLSADASFDEVITAINELEGSDTASGNGGSNSGETPTTGSGDSNGSPTPGETAGSTCPGDHEMHPGDTYHVPAGCIGKGDLEVNVNGAWVSAHKSDGQGNLLECPDGCEVLAQYGANISNRTYDDLENEQLEIGCANNQGCEVVYHWCYTDGNLREIHADEKCEGQSNDKTVDPDTSGNGGKDVRVQEVGEECDFSLEQGEIAIVPAGCIVSGDVIVNGEILHDNIQKTGLIVVINEDAEVEAPFGAAVTAQGPNAQATVDRIEKSMLERGCGFATRGGCDDVAVKKVPAD